jgi:hypothetical protein
MNKGFATTILLLSVCVSLASQVRIEIPARKFKANERITAKVVNATNRTIAYCVDHGPWLFPGNNILWIFTPFGVLQKPEGGKWGITLASIDLGHSSRIETLNPGDSEEYWFMLRENGERRLVFEYIFDNGENTNCSDPHRKWKKVKSPSFTVR